VRKKCGRSSVQDKLAYALTTSAKSAAKVCRFGARRRKGVNWGEGRNNTRWRKHVVPTKEKASFPVPFRIAEGEGF